MRRDYGGFVRYSSAPWVLIVLMATPLASAIWCATSSLVYTTMSRLTDPARLQKEIDAQKKRAEALALLSTSGGERHFKPGEVRKAREGKDGDNTLEVVTLRKAQQTYLEVSAKERLLQQQNSVREGVQRKQAAHAGAAAAASAGSGVGGDKVRPLPEGWKEIKDPKTGSTYYWKKASNATSWERPVASPTDTPKSNAPAVGGGEKGGSSGAGSASGSGQGASGGRGGGGTSASTGKGAAAAAAGGGAGKVMPLPAGWREVKDPKSGGVYFWNQSEGATTWVRPTGSASEGGASASGSRGDAASTPGLPEGWKAVTHAATGQTHYVHLATGKRSHTLPTEGSQNEPASSSERQHQQRQGAGAHAGEGRGAAGARGTDGRNRGARDRPKKKGRAGNWAIDPLDPTGKTGGKWSDGLVQVGERMADSTASGPLWQQRPYPAPGKILRGRAPAEAETAGPRQR